MSVRRIFLITALVLVLAPLGVIGAAMWTEVGSRLLIGFAADQVGVETSDIAGRLASTQCIGSLRFTNEAADVTATDVCIDVDWASSLDRFDAHVTSVTAGGLQVTVAESPPPSSPDLAPLDPVELVLPELPVEVRVQQLSLQRLTINEETLANVRINAVALNDQSWQLDELTVEYDQRRAVASLRLRNTREGARVVASVTTTDNARQELDANLSVNGPLDSLAVDLVVRLPTSAHAQGTLDTTQTNWPFDFSFAVDDTNLDSFGFTQSASATGRATGNVRDTTIDLTANSNDGTLQSHVDRADDTYAGTFVFDRFPIRTGGASSRANGRASVATGSGFQKIDITFDQLAGLFTKDPVNGSVKLTLDTPAIVLRKADLTAGSGSLTASGYWRSATDWQARALLDEFSVAFGLTAQLSGVLDARSADGGQIPNAKGRLELADLAYEDWSLEGLTLELDTDEQNWLNADGRNLAQAGNALDNITVKLRGQPESSAFALTAKHPAADLSATGNYAWQPPNERLTVDTASVRTNKETTTLDQTIELSQPVLATLEDGGFSMTDALLNNSAGGTALVAVATTGAATSARFTLQGWQVDNYDIGAVAESDQSVSATLNASVDIDDLSALVGKGTVAVDEIIISGLPPEIAEASNNPGTISIALDSTPNTQTATLNGGIEGVVDVDGRVQIDRVQSTLDGSLLASLPRSELIAPFVFPYASSPTGKMTAKLGLSGTIETPSFTGRMDWVDGGIDIDQLGLSARDINAAIVGENDNTLRIALNATDFDGQPIRAKGTVTDPLSAERTVVVTLNTTSAALLNRTDAKAHVTSDITYRSEIASDGEKTRHRIQGTARIDDAEFEIETLPESAVAPSPDVVVVGRETERNDQPIDIDLILDVDPKAHIVAFGLDTHIQGKLRYRAPAGKPVAATGTLNTVSGTFEAYGQTLEIQKGRLIFDGPIDDPLIELLATRKVRANDRDYVVALDASGYTAKLYTQVTSTPTLPEADALSLLVTGRLLRNTGDAEQVDVAAAALAMGIKGAGFLTDKIAATTGLDEFTVSQGQNGIEVGAGLRVNENLFLSYTYNALSRIGGVLIDYELSRRLRMRATAGDSQSIELQYVVTE